MSIPSTYLTVYSPGDRTPNHCDMCQLNTVLTEKIILWITRDINGVVHNRNYELLLCSACNINTRPVTRGDNGREAILNARRIT